MTLCEFCLSELSDPIDSTTYSSRNLSGHIRSIWTWWPLKVTVNGCNISYFSYTDRAKQEEKEEERKKKLHQYSFPLIEMLLLSGFIKNILPHFLQVSDNSSLLFETLSFDNQLHGRGSSWPMFLLGMLLLAWAPLGRSSFCPVVLLAGTPPGWSSSCLELLLAGPPPGRGSSWQGLLLAGAPHGWSSSWLGLLLVKAPPGQGSSWLGLLLVGASPVVILPSSSC